MMKLFVFIVLIAFLLIDPPSIQGRTIGLQESAWFNPSQRDYANHQLIKRKGQAGWGKRDFIPAADDDRTYLLRAEALRSWWDDQ